MIHVYINEYRAPANVDLSKAELHFTLSSLDTYLGGFTASFCFSSGERQDARLRLSVLWNVHERGNKLDMDVFNACKLILQKSLRMKSIQRKDINPEGQNLPLIDSVIYFICFPIYQDIGFS